MDKQHRKKLLEQYKLIKTYMGIYQIKNTVNGKIYIASAPNLKNKWLSQNTQLDMNRHVNFALQKDWREYGEAAFTYEVLEEDEVKEDTDKKWELKQLEEKWFEKLQPYGERGYHKSPAA